MRPKVGEVHTFYSQYRRCSPSLNGFMEMADWSVIPGVTESAADAMTTHSHHLTFTSKLYASSIPDRPLVQMSQNKKHEEHSPLTITPF